MTRQQPDDTSLDTAITDRTRRRKAAKPPVEKTTVPPKQVGPTGPTEGYPDEQPGSPSHEAPTNKTVPPPTRVEPKEHPGGKTPDDQ